MAEDAYVTLAAWQNALAELVVRQGRYTPHDEQLTDAERAWLARLSEDAGFRLTCAVQRWWRTAAVADSATLALGLLGGAGRLDLLTEYLDTHVGASLFPLHDGLTFLEFLMLNSASEEVAHLRSVARFEHALLRVTRASALKEPADDEFLPLDPSRTLERHPLADIIRF